MIYLASPYTDIIPEILEERYRAARTATAHLLRHRLHTFSPIVHCHDLARVEGLPASASFWAEYNFHMLSLATKLVVLDLPGWSNSVGVNNECAFWRVVRKAPIYIANMVECKTGNLDRVLS